MKGKKDILAAISPSDALAVLRELAKDPKIRKRAEDIAVAMASDVDVDIVEERYGGIW